MQYKIYHIENTRIFALVTAMYLCNNLDTNMKNCAMNVNVSYTARSFFSF